MLVEDDPYGALFYDGPPVPTMFDLEAEQGGEAPYRGNVVYLGTLSKSIGPGLRIGWAFAWRTLIAAELVFGTSSGSGGLGWFIYESKNTLDIPLVFAGLFTVILIGLLVESLVFRVIEERTIARWGMKS